ncbi:hypothetical protein J3F83DRAFT_732859 [Trichoderma novae-zelandiae]
MHVLLFLACVYLYVFYHYFVLTSTLSSFAPGCGLQTICISCLLAPCSLLPPSHLKSHSNDPSRRSSQPSTSLPQPPYFTLRNALPKIPFIHCPLATDKKIKTTTGAEPAMERTTKLAHLTLVSKYYPIANYSYPRSEGPSSSSSVASSSSSCRTPYNSRRSSDASRPSPLSPPPGLVDDRTDSEASSSADDDDFRYHVHGGELWDSFLESGRCSRRGHHQTRTGDNMTALASASFEAVVGVVPPAVPAKDYPALIASPQRIRRRPLPASSQQSPWPLSDHGHASQPRKPSPTYSVFPKMVSPPSSGTCTRQSSSSQLSTASLATTDASCPPQKALPPAPPPPPPCLPLPPPPPRSAASQYRSASPRPRAFSPASLATLTLQRPATSHGSRPASPMGLPYSLPPTPPPTAPLPALPPLSSRSLQPSTLIASRAPHYMHPNHAEAAVPVRPTPHVLRAYTSSTPLQLPRPPPDPLPRSVFEYDTDSDSDSGDDVDNGNSSSSASSTTESPTLSFFRFHRRSQSPSTNESFLTRRRGSASKTPLHQQQKQQQQYFVDAAATAAKDRRRRRKRTNTMDSLPPLMAKQADLVLSRMLGRRSR